MSLVSVADAIIGDIEAPYALIQSASRYFGTIFPDVVVREVHTDEDTITVHPVETGTPISDHVFANPQVVEISFGFSDSTGGYPGYTAQQYEAILALKATREPFDVSTGKRFYSNMLIAGLQEVTDENFEFAGMFTVRLQQVIITSTDGGSGVPDNSQQANPADTASTSDAGTQSLQAAPSAQIYRDYESGFGPSPGLNGSNI